MYALIQNNEIVKVFANPEGFKLNNNQYSSQIFTAWSKEAKEEIGIYEIETDSSNFKDEAYYINTNEIFSFSNGKATRSWGTAFAKQLEDVNAVDQNGAPILRDGVQVIIKGLKSQKISVIKQQASGLLSPTDWYVVKASEVEGYTIPTNIKTFRTAVRTKSNEMEAMINACTTVEQLKTLYEYTGETNPTRPIGEFPKLEVI
jgi:hypothetical protein